MIAHGESESTFRLVEQTDDLRSMSDTLRSVLESKSPATRVAEVADSGEGFDASLWQTLASELGVTGIMVPENLGGLGMGWAETRIVLAELGRSLACVPFANSCVVATTLIATSGDRDLAAEVLPGVADGSSIVAVALGDDSLLPPGGRSPIRATQIGDQWHLSGVQPFVQHGLIAHRFLILAERADGQHAWFLVESGAAGLEREEMACLDATRPQARLTMTAVPGRQVGRVGDCDSLVSPVLDTAVVAASCEASAASSHLLDLTVAYVSSRFQFGQPIGSFQALQHRLADLALAVDTSVSAVEYAVAAAVHDPARFREAASLAGFVCAETFYQAALEAIQMHGGIGFTWEHQAHRYYRRALSARAMLGAPSVHRERLLQSLSL